MKWKKLVNFYKEKALKIVLLGYMGSGKSTVGAALSQYLKMEFIDLDSYIEGREGKTISEIFSEHSELYFRKKEGEYLSDILTNRENFILATGGGTPCYGNNIKHVLNASANVFYLKLSLPYLVNRLAKEKEHRPLIKNISEEELTDFIGKHLFERSHYYCQANTIVNCDDKTPQETVELILDKLV